MVQVCEDLFSLFLLTFGYVLFMVNVDLFYEIIHNISPQPQTICDKSSLRLTRVSTCPAQVQHQVLTLDQALY